MSSRLVPRTRGGWGGHRPGGRGLVWTLAGIELVTGTLAAAGGVLLMLRPDGSGMMAGLAGLAGTPFTDWRVPGLLLATLVGGGGIAAAVWLLAGAPLARVPSFVYGIGLLAFELVEASWIPFSPLQVVFGLVGLAVAVLAIWAPRPDRRWA